MLPLAVPGAILPTGIAWYRKTFSLAPTMTGKQVNIRFGGVYQCSTVWVNGEQVGFRPYGYTEFTYDITPYLNKNDKKNVIAVRVDNSHQPNSRWYSGSGIYRSVWLTVTDPLHIPVWGTHIATTHADKQSATLQVAVKVKNAGPNPLAAILVSEILDAQNKVIGNMDTDIQIEAEQWSEFAETIDVENPALWSAKQAPFVSFALQDHRRWSSRG